MSGALSSASCDITHETGRTISYGHWVLRLATSHMGQGVRVVMGNGFCGHGLLQALGSASCDISHETGGTICYTGIGLCVL